MGKPGSRWRAIGVPLGILVSAAAYFVSTGLGEFWLAAWIAPLPVLILAFQSSARTAAAIGFVAYLLGSFNLLPYLTAIVPVGMIVGTMLVSAAAFALVVLVARQAVLRLEPWVSVFAFPATWTCLEWLVAMASPHGTALSIAYSQADVLPLLQVASLTGLWGITFVLTLVPASLAVAWHFRARRRRAVLALVPGLAIALLTLGYGWVRLARPAPRPAARVGLAATDQTIRYFRTEQPDEALPVVRAYARRVGELAARGARVVVLPEKFVGVTPGYLNEVIGVLREAARANRVTVVAGLNLVGTAPRRNLAIVIGPDGEVLIEYDKVFLLPGLEEGYQAGTRPGLFPVSDAVWGVAICKDMDFPDWGRAYARAGAGVVVVPAWDFVRDARLHARMAHVRGVESGFAVVRSAQEGLLTVSDHHGRAVAVEASWGAPEVLLVSEVTPGPGHTLYSAVGNWFGWTSLLVLALILVGTVVRTLEQGRRTRRGT